jgi:hypothetical protein
MKRIRRDWLGELGEHLDCFVTFKFGAYIYYWENKRSFSEGENNCLRDIRETVCKRGERATVKGIRWGSSCLGARMLAL